MILNKVFPSIDPSDPDVGILVGNINNGDAIDRAAVVRLLAKIHYPLEHPESPVAQSFQLMEICREFIDTNYISGPEAVYQSDKVWELAPNLVAEIGEVIGWSTI